MKRYVALLAMATLWLVGSAYGHETVQTISEPGEGDFESWLQYMTETSDDDTMDDADAVTGTWTSEELQSQDDVKKPQDERKPKVNRDSIGVLPKPVGLTKKVVVSKDGKGDYTTITAALESIPLQSTHRTIIHIRAGVYRYDHLGTTYLELLSLATMACLL